MPDSEWGVYSFGPSSVLPHPSFPGLWAKGRLVQCQSSQTWPNNHHNWEQGSIGISSSGRAGQVSSHFLALISTSAASAAINNKGYLICEMHWSVKQCPWVAADPAVVLPSDSDGRVQLWICCWFLALQFSCLILEPSKRYCKTHYIFNSFLLM